MLQILSTLLLLGDFPPGCVCRCRDDARGSRLQQVRAIVVARVTAVDSVRVYFAVEERFNGSDAQVESVPRSGSSCNLFHAMRTPPIGARYLLHIERDGTVTPCLPSGTVETRRREIEALRSRKGNP